MGRTLAVWLFAVLVGGAVSAFDEKDLKPVPVGVQHMWHTNADGAHVCLFQYKYLGADTEKALEEFFPGYLFYVVAVWNEQGQENVLFDGDTHTFRLVAKEEKPYGNISSLEPFVLRINAKIGELNRWRDYCIDMDSRFTFNVFTGEMFDDEAGQWARAHKLTTRAAIRAYKAKLEAAAFSLQNLAAVMRPFNCAVGDRLWALVPIRQEMKNTTPMAVFYINGAGKPVPMDRVGLTKPMIKELQIKQREFGARFESR